MTGNSHVRISWRGHRAKRMEDEASSGVFSEVVLPGAAYCHLQVACSCSTSNLHLLIVEVKMAQDAVKRVTGWKPTYQNMPDMSAFTPFRGSPDKTSGATVSTKDGQNHCFQPESHDHRIRPSISEVPTSAPQGDKAHGIAADCSVCFLSTSCQPRTPSEKDPWGSKPLL